MASMQAGGFVGALRTAFDFYISHDTERPLATSKEMGKVEYASARPVPDTPLGCSPLSFVNVGTSIFYKVVVSVQSFVDTT